MPLYEYKCSKCGKISEVLERTGKSSGSHKCQHCGSTHLEKQFSLPARAIMKGSSNPFQATDTCCGLTNPCDDPKRCCGR